MATPIILPDNLDEMIEEAGKPQLPEGKYLAVITGGEPKLSDNGKNSYGVNWTLLVNKNPDSLEDGWDSEAGTIEVRYYTYIGKYENGRLSDTDKGWAFTKMMRILGVTGKSFNPDDAKFRQIGVIIEHVAGKEDRDAMKVNPNHVPDQLYLGVKTVTDYIIGTEHAPKLANLAEAYEEQRSATATELDEVFGAVESKTEPVAEPTTEAVEQTTEAKPAKAKKAKAETSDSW